MDKMQEEFEAWCSERGYTLRPAETNCGVRIEGEYGHNKVQIAWEAWKASRAALCVELPKHEAAWWSEDVLDALNNAGVSHK